MVYTKTKILFAMIRSNIISRDYRWNYTIVVIIFVVVVMHVISKKSTYILFIFYLNRCLF